MIEGLFCDLLQNHQDYYLIVPSKQGRRTPRREKRIKAEKAAFKEQNRAQICWKTVTNLLHL